MRNASSGGPARPATSTRGHQRPAHAAQYIAQYVAKDAPRRARSLGRKGMVKICPVCEVPFESKTSAKFCSPECRETRRDEGQNPRQRHAALLRVLEKERISQTDMLYHENYYFALIAYGICFWCLGTLSRTGFALDRRDPSKPHSGDNAWIPACGRCNSTRSNLYTFEQFLLLKPGLEAIRRQEIVGKKKDTK